MAGPFDGGDHDRRGGEEQLEECELEERGDDENAEPGEESVEGVASDGGLLDEPGADTQRRDENRFGEDDPEQRPEIPAGELGFPVDDADQDERDGERADVDEFGADHEPDHPDNDDEHGDTEEGDEDQRFRPPHRRVEAPGFGDATGDFGDPVGELPGATATPVDEPGGQPVGGLDGHADEQRGGRGEEDRDQEHFERLTEKVDVAAEPEPHEVEQRHVETQLDADDFEGSVFVGEPPLVDGWGRGRVEELAHAAHGRVDGVGQRGGQGAERVGGPVGEGDPGHAGGVPREAGDPTDGGGRVGHPLRDLARVLKWP